MPVDFLTPAQRASFGRFDGNPAPEVISQFFHLAESDLTQVERCRGDHNRLGFALQLTTVRYLGTFLEDPTDVPCSVLQALGRQLAIPDLACAQRYLDGKRRWDHAAEIRTTGGYQDFTTPTVALRLARWLYSPCWTGTDQPGVLFDRARDWMLGHKVLLSGATALEKFVARLRSRVAARLHRWLCHGVTAEQQANLESLLVVPEGCWGSLLDQLRVGPTRVSGPALVKALERLQAIRDPGITLPDTANLPPARLAALARFTQKAKLTALTRLPEECRVATLVAFLHCLEATANDEVLELLEGLLSDLFHDAALAQKQARIRTQKDLDEAAGTMLQACQVLLDAGCPDVELRARVFAVTPEEELTRAVEEAMALIRPPDDVYYKELENRYGSVRRYLPAVLKYLDFGFTPTGRKVIEALSWLRDTEDRAKPAKHAPREIITKPWEHHVLHGNTAVNPKTYTFCVLGQLHEAFKRREIFVKRSWRCADPRAGLLEGAEWEPARPVICRTLNLPTQPGPLLDALAEELDRTYKAVAARLPVVDLPEILLEMAARTGFTEAFTHVSESAARAEGLSTSLCAVLLAEACNTGIEPLVRSEIPSLRRDRLTWVNQNYVRDETLTAANTRLVAAQNQILLAHAWGGGEVASADGMRFVVPVRTVHAGPNPKYFGQKRGMTWYNLLSNQFTGLNGIPLPGTLKDSLFLLALVLDQQTELHPTQILTDNGAYTDVVFGLFRLLGYRFSPRLADIGGIRFWRIDPHADYGELNALARQRVHLERISENWDEVLRLVGSLKLGRVPATGIMRMLQVGDRPTRLAQALAEIGRIEKTLHVLTTLDDETRRRATLIQLNRPESRHSLGLEVFHGKRGELRQKYREGQEDQLGALGLVLNTIVLWNTLYMDAALAQLRAEGHPVREEDVARLSPLGFKHINFLGRYSFYMLDYITRGELRPLRDPSKAA